MAYTALPNRVIDVLLVSANPKVLWSDASRIIPSGAVVADFEAIGDWAIMQDP